jgi:hypothetical protein
VAPWDPDQPTAGLRALSLDTVGLQAVHGEATGTAAWRRAFDATSHAWRGQMIYRVP